MVQMTSESHVSGDWRTGDNVSHQILWATWSS